MYVLMLSDVHSSSLQALSTIATEGGEQRTLVESKSTFNERDSVVVQEEQATGDGLTST